MAYAVVRTDNLLGTVSGAYLESLIYHDAAGDEAELENGAIVHIGDYVDGEREIREATAPTVSDTIDTLAVVASEEVVKDKTYNVLNEFINLAGSYLCGYTLHKHAKFSVTKEGFADGALPEKGTSVGVNAGETKLATDGSVAIGTVVAVEGKYAVIEVA